MSSINAENNSELDNPLKERIKVLMTEHELAHPYSFATRVGLSKGTFTGIWREGRQSLHQGTINKICTVTGADPEWLATGKGIPFPVYNYDEIITRQIEEACQLDDEAVSVELDTALLKQAFDILEEALEATGRIIQPKGASRFVATVYASLKEDEDMDTEVLQDCILTVEEALKATRRVMSSKAKTDLILAVYELYSGNALYKEAMTSTINQLIRSVS